MTVTKKTTCGFIGLGSQGAPMAMRMIEAGYPTVLWARRTASLENFAETGAIFAQTIADLAREAEHVGVCVVNDDDVREVCAKLIPVLAPGSRVAIHSTVHPDTVRQIANESVEFGVQVIDAPVSGGEPAAKAGELTVMVGGETGAVAQARPIFETFGTLIPYLGEVGAGQNAKLINNALLAANMAMADHALGAANALGIDKEAMAELLSASSGRSFGLEVRARLPELEAFRHGGALLVKDLCLLRAVLPMDPGVFGLWNGAERLVEAFSGETSAS